MAGTECEVAKTSTPVFVITDKTLKSIEKLVNNLKKLGITAITLFLPLSVAVAHNAGAAVLLSITLAVNLKLASSSRARQRIGVSREAARYEEVVHE